MLEVKNVTKIYSRQKKGRGGAFTALDDVSFTVEEGEIVGLVGPNGAGKSTAIKCITGLARQTSGSITVNGYDTVRESVNSKLYIGAIIENPDMYPDWSGEENLKYLVRLAGHHDKPVGMSERDYVNGRVEDALKLVGLYDRRKDKTSKYSLGMKQRLGIAQAILSKPKLLILDEPANGLDPAGIHEIREIIKKLSHEMGIAVLISSHVLSEMQQLCDRFIILKGGKIVATFDAEQLNSDGENAVILTVDDVVKAKDILKEKFDLNAEIVASGKLEVKTDLSGGDLAKELIMGGVNVNGIATKEASLEDMFLKITSEQNKNSRDDKRPAETEESL